MFRVVLKEDMMLSFISMLGPFTLVGCMGSTGHRQQSTFKEVRSHFLPPELVQKYLDKPFLTQKVPGRQS